MPKSAETQLHNVLPVFLGLNIQWCVYKHLL